MEEIIKPTWYFQTFKNGIGGGRFFIGFVGYKHNSKKFFCINIGINLKFIYIDFGIGY